MKKTLPALGILAAAALIAGVCFGLFNGPNLDRVELTASPGHEGGVWLIENRPRSSFLYHLDDRGKLVQLRREDSRQPGRRSAITAVAAFPGGVYYLRESGPEDGFAPDRTELLLWEPGQGRAGVVWTSPSGWPVQADHLAVGEDGVYLAGHRAGAASAYRLDPGEEEPQAELVSSFSHPEGEAVLRAVWGADTLYAVTGDGALLRQRQGDSLRREDGPVSALSSSGEAVLFCRAGYLHYADRRVPFEAVEIPAGSTARAGAARAEEDLTLLVRQGERVSLIRFDGGEWSQLRAPRASLRSVPAFAADFLACYWREALAVLGILLMAVLAFRARSLSAKTVLLTGCAVLLVFSLVCKTAVLAQRGMLLQERASALEDGNGIDVQGWMAPLAALEQGAPPPVERLRSGDGMLQQLLRVESAWPVVAASPVHAPGQSGDAVLEAAPAALVQRTHTTGAAAVGDAHSAGVWTVYCATPFAAGGETWVLLTSAALPDLEVRLEAYAGRYWLLGLCAGVLAVLAVALLTRPMAERVRALSRRMLAVAEGDFTTYGFSTAADDVGAMQRAMEEMCLSLSIRDYEARSTLHSYERFVPQGLERLLGRANVTEVICGDVATVEDCVSIFSVHGAADLRNRLDNQQFMQFVNHCFSLVYGGLRQHGALLLSGDFDIAAIRVLHPGDPDSGVRFGLQLSGETATGSGALPPPVFTQILHSTEFLYGVAGVQEKVFQFLSSSVLAYLGTLSEKLQGLGLRTVMTDAYRSKLGGAYNTRYIGFVSSPDGRHTFKLYELLDCFGDHDMTVRLQYDAKFQESVQQFYKNNFYLARSGFSSILKACPDDGVARWYVFACERFFNESDMAKVSYNLFGVEE